MMDFRALRHFVALAEELHFGRAAQKLGMTQPPLSQSIKRLEQQLGVKLVDRSTRSVSLLPSGATFAIEARRLLQQLEFVERLVKRTAAGEVATLTVGLIGPALYRILPRTLELLRSHAGLEMRLEELPSEEQIKRLRDGRLDLAMTSGTQVDLQGLAVRTVERSGPIAAVPADWPIAQQAELHLADLKDCPFVMTPYERSPESRAALFSACYAAGFTPKIVQEATQTNTRLNFVSAGFGVAIVTATARYTEYHGVRFIPIVDLSDEALSWELSIVWVPRGVTRPLRTLIECFSKASGDLEAVPEKVLPDTVVPYKEFASDPV